MTNTNNPIEFLLNLGINTTDSKTNIKNAITQIQKDLNQDLDVTLTVKSNTGDSKVFSEMEKQITDLKKQIDVLNKEIAKVGSPTTSSGSSSNAFKPIVDGAKNTIYTLEQLKKQAVDSNASLDFKYIGDDLTQYKTAIISLKNELGELQKVSYQALYSDQGELEGFKAVETAIKNTDFDKFNEKQREAVKLLNEFEKQGKMSSQQIREFKNDIESASDNTSLTKIVEQLKDVNKEAAREIKHATIHQINKDADGLLRKINELAQSTGVNTTTQEFQQLINKVTDLSQRKIFNDQDLVDATKDFNNLNTQVNKLITSTNNFDKVNHKINDFVVTLGRIGVLDTTTLSEYYEQITKIGNSSDSVTTKITKLKTLLGQIQDASDSANHKNSMALAMEKAENEVEDLLIQLRKVENQWKRTVNRDEVAKVRAELGSLKIPDFTTTTQVTDFNKELDTVKRRIKSIASEATTSARSSMGVIESFKIAMERFPIWMAASTIFYGATRAVKDLTTNVIELDKIMTNLRRVMDLPDYKFNEILEKSIVNVTNLSGLLQDYMKLVEEFGRMGFSDVESLDMADTAAMLQNISELTPDQSVSSLVAAMINFNIVAEDSIRIADKLNEIDNNYSTNTLTLSQAMNKASSTAKTFGVSLDELLGHTTAISAATRESGCH